MVPPGDPALLESIPFARLAGAYSRAFNPALRRWAELAGPEAFSSVLKILLEANENGRAPFARMDLWCELADLWQGRPDARSSLRYLLAETFPFLQDPDEDDEEPDYRISPRKEPETCSPDLLARFLHHLESWPEKEDREAFPGLVAINENTFPPDDLILPALERVAGDAFAVGPDTVGLLWRHCSEWVLARSATPPETPKNWTLPLTDRQLKGLRADLKKFALDHYDRACRRYEKDVATLRRLLRLPAAQSAANADTATRLAAALEAGESWKPDQAVGPN